MGQLPPGVALMLKGDNTHEYPTWPLAKSQPSGNFPLLLPPEQEPRAPTRVCGGKKQHEHEALWKILSAKCINI